MKNLRIRQFNIQEWLNNPAILVCTREGEEVQVMSYKPELKKPVTFGIHIDTDMYEYEQCYENGICSHLGNTPNDIFIYSYDANDESMASFQEDLKETIYCETH